MHTFEVMGDVIENQEEVTPTYLLLRPLQMQVAILPSAGEELLDTHFGRDLFEWLLGIGNREWDQNCPRPGRYLVDVEPEPVRKENNLRRNGRHSVVIVLAEEAEI